MLLSSNTVVCENPGVGIQWDSSAIGSSVNNTAVVTGEGGTCLNNEGDALSQCCTML